MQVETRGYLILEKKKTTLDESHTYMVFPLGSPVPHIMRRLEVNQKDSITGLTPCRAEFRAAKEVGK